MAKETALTLFIGTDHQFVFTILDDEEATAIDISGWTLSFMVKRKVTHPDGAALLTKTTSGGILITGTYDPDPSQSTQVAQVSIADTDTDPLTAGDRVWELKRMDAGAEAVLAYGDLALVQAVHRT